MKTAITLIVSLFPAVVLAKAPSCAHAMRSFPLPVTSYITQQPGRVVYSSKMHFDYATAPERFTVTVMRVAKARLVASSDCPSSGVARPGAPLEFNHLTSTPYTARINGKLVTNYVRSGQEFTLIALRHNRVEILGTICHLVRMQTRAVHGTTFQFPVTRDFFVDKRARLMPGQSTMIVMGDYRVLVVREVRHHIRRIKRHIRMAAWRARFGS